MSQTLGSGAAYDAVSLLGFGDAVAGALPTASSGEVVLRYGGWSLQDVRARMVPRELMWDQSWYDVYHWSAEKLPSGLYVLRLPVPESSLKTFDEQKALLLPGEEAAPIVLAATALLALRLSGQPDPLHGDWTRCREQIATGCHAALEWHDGRLHVDYDWDGYPCGYLWLSSARGLPEPCTSNA